MEEDIKILEELRKELGLYANGEKIKQGQVLENLIKGYRELEEREIWSTATINGLKRDFIPKSKIKDKIEELEKYIYKGENAPQDFLQYRIKAKIQVLQELMEDK